MATYFSDGGTYAVECPDNKVEETRTYVHAVEDIVPALREVFSPLTPSFSQFNVVFGDKGPLYRSGGKILLRADMNLRSDGKRYGGLFHETAHGFVEKYIHRPRGVNVHPSEALAIILQVAALYKVNDTWASKYRNGHGSSKSVHRWLFELGRIYGEEGIEPIRAIYREMGESPIPIFRNRETYVSDVNCLWERLGFSCRLSLSGTDGLVNQ